MSEFQAKKIIGLDATVLAYNQEGIGNYVKNVLLNLPEIEQVRYVVYIFVQLDDALLDRLNQRPDIKIVGLEQSKGMLSGIKNARKLSMQARQDNVNVMISTHSHLLPIFFRPTVWLIHDISPVTHPEWFTFNGNMLKQWLFKFLFEKGIRTASQIMTISKFSQSEIIEHFKVQKNKVQVIGIGPGDVITDDTARTSASDEEILEKFKLTSEEYFLFLGTLSPRKNIEGLIDGYVEYLKLQVENSRSVDELPKLVIAGKKGWLFESIFSHIETQQKKHPELELEEKIVFTGFLTKLEAKALIVQAKAFVMSSHYEGFGMPILEALLLGKEVVASDIDVFKENFEGYVHFFNHSDNENLAKNLEEVYNGSRLNTEAKIKQLKQKFNWKTVSQSLINNILKANK